MDLRLLLSTFALVFLAELGDKTQLASMAASAGSKSPWSVFAGAALALVTSTLIAVLVGSTLQRLVPGHYIKFAASIIFFVFGTVLLVNAFHTKAEAAKLPGPAARPGILARLVLDAAAAFERSAAGDYRRMAADATDPGLREVLLHLAREEDGHLDHVSAMTADHGQVAWSDLSEAPASVAGPAPAGDSLTIIESAIAHEEATVRFYQGLAHSAPLSQVRAAFARMAEEEASHVQHLREFRDTGATKLHAVSG